MGWGRGLQHLAFIAGRVPWRRLGQEGKEPMGERRLPVWDEETWGEPMSLTPSGPLTTEDCSSQLEDHMAAQTIE